MSKTSKARELAQQGKSVNEIRELVPCGKTTAFNAVKWAQQQAGAGRKPGKPGVEVIEKPVEGEIPAMAPSEVPEEPEEPEAPEEPGEVPEIPIEVTVDDVHNFIDAILGTDTWGDYGMASGKTKSLARLWFPVFRKHWDEIVESWGLEIMAVVGTIVVVGGHVRSVGRKKKEEKEKAKP